MSLDVPNTYRTFRSTGLTTSKSKTRSKSTSVIDSLYLNLAAFRIAKKVPCADDGIDYFSQPLYERRIKAHPSNIKKENLNSKVGFFLTRPLHWIEILCEIQSVPCCSRYLRFFTHLVLFTYRIQRI